MNLGERPGALFQVVVARVDVCPHCEGRVVVACPLWLLGGSTRTLQSTSTRPWLTVSALAFRSMPDQRSPRTSPRRSVECTGFGLNLVSGNSEFPGLVVIDTEDFWLRCGGHIEANWESSTLRQYSSLDSESLTELVHDAAWSNEGLFALLQGLRRLKQIGGNRVNLPMIEWQ